jgi:hypothetical protein
MLQYACHVGEVECSAWMHGGVVAACDAAQSAVVVAHPSAPAASRRCFLEAFSSRW